MYQTKEKNKKVCTTHTKQPKGQKNDEKAQKPATTPYKESNQSTKSINDKEQSPIYTLTFSAENHVLRPFQSEH